jgi:hypothetical protein
MPHYQSASESLLWTKPLAKGHPSNSTQAYQRSIIAGIGPWSHTANAFRWTNRIEVVPFQQRRRVRMANKQSHLGLSGRSDAMAFNPL